MIYLTTLLLIKSDWTTFTFVIVVFLLAISKWLYKDRLFHLISIFFSKDYFIKYGKDTQLIFSWFNCLLFLVQALILSLLIVAYITLYKPTIIDSNSLYLFSLSFLAVILFFGIRYIVGKVLAIIFELNKAHDYLTFAKMSYLYSSVLLIIPFVFLTYYIKTYNLLLFQLTILLFTILLIVRYVNILINNKKIIFRRLFYFILYLCALEIAPILLTYKILV